MSDALETLDLNPVLAMVERWDAHAHRRMVRHAARLNAGEHVPTESWPETRSRLGL